MCFKLIDRCGVSVFSLRQQQNKYIDLACEI